jgi:hypothetical protein
VGVKSCRSLALCVGLGREDMKVDGVGGLSGGDVSNCRIGGGQCFKMLKSRSGSDFQFARDRAWWWSKHENLSDPKGMPVFWGCVVVENWIFVLPRFGCVPSGAPNSANVVRNHERSRHGRRRFVSSMKDLVCAREPKLSSPECVWFSSWLVAQCLSWALKSARRMCSTRLARKALGGSLCKGVKGSIWFLVPAVVVGRATHVKKWK